MKEHKTSIPNAMSEDEMSALLSRTYQRVVPDTSALKHAIDEFPTSQPSVTSPRLDRHTQKDIPSPFIHYSFINDVMNWKLIAPVALVVVFVGVGLVSLQDGVVTEPQGLAMDTAMMRMESVPEDGAMMEGAPMLMQAKMMESPVPENVTVDDIFAAFDGELAVEAELGDSSQEVTLATVDSQAFNEVSGAYDETIF